MDQLAPALDALNARLRDDWSATPIAWPNVAFDADAPGGGFAPGGAFLMPEIAAGPARFASFGAPGDNLRRQQGELHLDLLVPLGEGAGRARELALAAGALFEAQSFAGARCGALRLGPALRAGRWWRQRASVAFQVDSRG